MYYTLNTRVLSSEHHNGEICKHMEPTVDPTHTLWHENKFHHFQKNRYVVHGNVSQELFLKSSLRALPLQSPQSAHREAKGRLQRESSRSWYLRSCLLSGYFSILMLSCHVVLCEERGLLFWRKETIGGKVVILEVTMWPSRRMGHSVYFLLQRQGL